MLQNKVKFGKHAMVKKSDLKGEKFPKHANIVFFEIFVGYVCTPVYDSRVNSLQLMLYKYYKNTVISGYCTLISLN